MRATIALDDELVRQAQELTGVTERTALVRDGLRALIHLEASRRLAAVGGTEPELKAIKRVRAGNVGATKVSREMRRASIASPIIPSGATPSAEQNTELAMAIQRKAKRRTRWSVR